MNDILKNFVKLISKIMTVFTPLIHSKSLKMPVGEALKNINDIYEEKPIFINSNISNKEYDNEIMLSLIIPVYNAEKYIDKCINSIINSKTKFKFEAIFINDGSTDKSLEILNNYSGKYNFIKVITQKNQGISGARNTGVSNAIGKYIGFIDNDDEISEDYIEVLLNKVKDTDSDIIKCAWCSIDNSNKVISRNILEKISIKGNMKEKIFKYDGMIWGGIIKRKLWENFRFPIGYWYEDAVTRNYLYRVAKSFEYIDQILYYKRVHNNNASKILWDSANVKALDHFFIIKNITNFCQHSKIPNDKYLYYNLINEFGPFLWWRTRKLDKKIKKSVFVLACDYIENLNIEFYKDYNNIDMKYLEKSIINKDYLLWNYVSMYKYFLR